MSSRAENPLRMVTCDPNVRRDYKKRINYEDHKEDIREAVSQGQPQAKIIRSLAKKGLVIKPCQLKYFLRKEELSRKNRKLKSYSQKADDGTPLRSDIGSIHPQFDLFTDLETGLDEGISTDSSDSAEPPIDADQFEWLMARIFSLKRAEIMLEGTKYSIDPEMCQVEFPQHPNDLAELYGRFIDPNTWSEDFKEDLEKWVVEKRSTSDYVLNKLYQEMDSSPDDGEDTCFERIQENWNYLEWKGQGRDHERRLLPIHIYQSFWREYDDTQPLLAEELEEMTILKKVFEANFPVLLEHGLSHLVDTETGKDFRSQVVHLLRIERRFGPTHMLLVEAMFKAAGMLHQMDGLATNAGIVFADLILRKLRRLGLEPGYDSAHAILHMKRSYEMLGNFAAALDVENQYVETRKMMNNKSGAFPRTLNMIQQATELFEDGKSLGVVLALLKEGSGYVDCFTVTHGHYNTAWDYGSLGRAFLRFGCLPEAAESFEMAIQHFTRTGKNRHPCRYQDKRYQTERMLAELYLRMGKDELALENFKNHFLFRRWIYGPGDSLAISSLQAIRECVDQKPHLYSLYADLLEEKRPISPFVDM